VTQAMVLALVVICLLMRCQVGISFLNRPRFTAFRGIVCDNLGSASTGCEPTIADAWSGRGGLLMRLYVLFADTLGKRRDGHRVAQRQALVRAQILRLRMSRGLPKASPREVI